MKEKLKLCQPCAPTTLCWFQTAVLEVISEKVNPLEKQDPLEANATIASLREQARDILNCPNLNKINPDSISKNL